MVNLTAINKTKKAYTDTDHELLFLGIFQDKKLNPRQRSLDTLLNNAISRAMKIDRFTGKEEKILLIYANESIKLVLLL